nr:EscU/YscU/HrcU family type III secretion system export apparatus switch protein [uncultured Bacillus sp.]
MDKQEQRKAAVALSYNEQAATAPAVVAKGKGLIAEKIIAQAKEHQVPIQEDPSLVELLGKLNINEKIPEELYLAVAEVFSFIYRTDREAINLNKKFKKFN